MATTSKEAAALTAYEVLEKSGIISLPVDMKQVARAMGIKVVSYRSCVRVYDKSMEELYAISRFGFSFIAEGMCVCAVNENSCGETRRRFTIAHELGHCLLGHLRGEAFPPNAEREADRFAAELLTPLPVLHLCGVCTPSQIAKLCGVSAKMAEIRCAELAARRRSAYEHYRALVTDTPAAGARPLPDSGEKRITERFYPFIAKCLFTL